MIILTKFHEDRAKIVDFLLIVNFSMCALFFESVFTSFEHKIWNCEVVLTVRFLVFHAQNYFTEKEKIIRALAVRDKNLPLVTINLVRFFSSPKLCGSQVTSEKSKHSCGDLKWSNFGDFFSSVIFDRFLAIFYFEMTNSVEVELPPHAISSRTGNPLTPICLPFSLWRLSGKIPPLKEWKN